MPGIIDDVQHLVDQLAERLRRSVSLDDRHRRYLTSSRHFGDLDDLRINVLLSRELNPDASAYLFGFVDAENSGGPIAVPENDALGISYRRCYPIQRDTDHVGYLWLIGDASQTEDKLIAEALPRLAEALIHPTPQTQLDPGAWDALPQQLILPTRRDAIQKLRNDGAFDLQRQLVVIASYTPHLKANAGAHAQKLGHLISQALLDRRVLRMPAAAHGSIAITLLRSPPSQPRENLSMLFAQETDEGSPDGLAVGHSDWGSLDEIEELLTQAILSAYTALEWSRTVVPWSKSSYFGLLLKGVLEDPGSVIPPEVTYLCTIGASADLVKTASTFLYEAGDVGKASQRLRIHRTTLYYRLGRIEELTGYDLKNGDDRLALHIGIALTKFLESQLPAFLRSEEN